MKCDVESGSIKKKCWSLKTLCGLVVFFFSLQFNIVILWSLSTIIIVLTETIDTELAWHQPERGSNQRNTADLPDRRLCWSNKLLFLQQLQALSSTHASIRHQQELKSTGYGISSITAMASQNLTNYTVCCNDSAKKSPAMVLWHLLLLNGFLALSLENLAQTWKTGQLKMLLKDFDFSIELFVSLLILKHSSKTSKKRNMNSVSGDWQNWLACDRHTIFTSIKLGIQYNCEWGMLTSYIEKEET